MKHYYYVYGPTSLRGPAKRHATVQEAQKEAERLACIHPGQSFEILLCVGVSSTPAVRASTFWVDGYCQATEDAIEKAFDEIRANSICHASPF